MKLVDSYNLKDFRGKYPFSEQKIGVHVALYTAAFFLESQTLAALSLGSFSSLIVEYATDQCISRGYCKTLQGYTVTRLVMSISLSVIMACALLSLAGVPLTAAVVAKFASVLVSVAVADMLFDLAYIYVRKKTTFFNPSSVAPPPVPILLVK